MTGRPPRRVLVITAYVPPTGGGGTIRIAKLVRYLAPLGWAADLVGWADAPAGLDDPSLVADLPPGTRVVRVSTPLRRLEAGWGARARRRGAGPRGRPFQVLGGLRAAIHAVTAIPDAWIGWALRVASLPRDRLARWEPVDAVVSSGPPHSAHLAGLLLARRLRAPLLLDLRDEWTLNPLFRSRVGVRRWVDASLERACVRAAAAVVTVSDVSADRYRRRYPRVASRFHVIPNGFDPADLDGLPPRVPAPAAGPAVLGHVGSLRSPRSIRPLLEALERRRSASSATMRLLLAGDVDADQLDAALALLGDAVEAPGHVPHDEAVRLMARCDVLLLLSHRGEAGPASLTGKVYEELALRRPILAITPEGPGSRLVVDSGAGAWADPDDPGAIDRALRRVLELASDPAFAGAPDELIARFDRRRQAAAWHELLERATARSGAALRR